MLLYKVYTVVIDRTRKEKTYWGCINRKLCSARLKTIDDEVSTTSSEHVHPSTLIENTAVKVVEEIKLFSGRAEVLSSIAEIVAFDIPLSRTGCLLKIESLIRTKRWKKSNY